MKVTITVDTEGDKDTAQHFNECIIHRMMLRQEVVDGLDECLERAVNQPDDVITLTVENVMVSLRKERAGDDPRNN